MWGTPQWTRCLYSYVSPSSLLLGFSMPLSVSTFVSAVATAILYIRLVWPVCPSSGKCLVANLTFFFQCPPGKPSIAIAYICLPVWAHYVRRGSTMVYFWEGSVCFSTGGREIYAGDDSMAEVCQHLWDPSILDDRPPSLAHLNRERRPGRAPHRSVTSPSDGSWVLFRRNVSNDSWAVLHMGEYPDIPSLLLKAAHHLGVGPKPGLVDES